MNDSNFTLITLGKYNVWKTDYENYSLVYTCKLRNVLDYYYRVDNAWILSRTRTLDAVTVENLKKTLIDAGVYADRFLISDQRSCD